MTFGDEIRELATKLRAACLRRGFKVATVESCTGGLIAAAITDIPGSSDIFDRGFVTYSDAAKEELVGVPEELIGRHGAVSAEVAIAMAVGALARSHADLVVAVTGIAGPDGGSAEKPVGLVYFGLTSREQEFRYERRVFPDKGRAEIRSAAVAVALDLLVKQAVK